MEKGLTSNADRGGAKWGLRQARPGTQVRIQNPKLNQRYKQQLKGQAHNVEDDELFLSKQKLRPGTQCRG